MWKSQFHFVLGLCVQNCFNKSSTEYLMIFYIIYQNWSRLCRYFSPPCFTSIEKSNEIRLLCFLLKNSYFSDIYPDKLILFIESADVATKLWSWLMSFIFRLLLVGMLTSFFLFMFSLINSLLIVIELTRWQLPSSHLLLCPADKAQNTLTRSYLLRYSFLQ